MHNEWRWEWKKIGIGFAVFAALSLLIIFGNSSEEKTKNFVAENFPGHEIIDSKVGKGQSTYFLCKNGELTIVTKSKALFAIQRGFMFMAVSPLGVNCGGGYPLLKTPTQSDTWKQDRGGGFLKYGPY